MENNTEQTLSRRARNLFQVTFSDHSMRELNKLPVEDQLALVDKISNMSPEQINAPDDTVGKLSREGKHLYRVRAGEFRCYFEVKGDTLFAQYILHKNSLTDFVYRNKLPISEETMIEQHKSFWKYLESFNKK